MPGFYIECTPAEALLQSSLVCLYNQTCIDTVLSYLHPNSAFVPALTTSTADSYLPNAVVPDLMDLLMVEAWNLSADHSSYFNACLPAQCAYTYATRNDVLFIVTTLFGLAGGLVTVLTLVAPLSVKYIFRIVRRVRQSPRRLAESEESKCNGNVDSTMGANRLMVRQSRLESEAGYQCLNCTKR